MSNHSPLDKHKFPHLFEALQQEHWHLTKLLLLLVTICIASLGSLSVAQHFLPPGPIVKLAPTAITYTDGVCNADPAQQQYVLPSSAVSQASLATIDTPKNFSALSFYKSLKTLTHSAAPAPTPTPNQASPAWYNYGFSNSDLTYVQACAATFVQAYHTFNASDPKTFEAVTPMLSADALKLFYQGGPDDKYLLHLHMNPTWQATIKRNQQIQQANIQKPIFASITPLSNGKFLVTMDVAYTLIKQINGQPLPNSHHQDQIILQNTQPSPKLPNETKGWQVTSWIDGDV